MWYILLAIILIMIVYFLYFKDYVEVKKIFRILIKTLDTRDLLIMKLVPEFKNKKERAEIIKLVDGRMKSKRTSYTEQIKLDVELNDRLKEMYLELEKERNNPVIKAALANAFELEKTLKKVRDEYNMAVEKYNMNLIMHKFVCMRIIRMKPLDIYGKISHLEVR